MLRSDLLQNAMGYIGGRWAAADSRETRPVINPATGEELARVPVMGASETTRAVEAARGTLHSATSIEKRREWLDAISDLLRANKQELGRIVTLEQGKPWNEAQAEVEYAAGFYRYCAEHADALQPRTLEQRIKGCTWTVHYRPAGVAGLITPWNFPIAMMAKKLSAALLADCPSVMKPAEQTPLTLIAMMQLVDEQLDLPPGKLNLVIGAAGPIGEVLCNHPAVRVISFTGSTEVGKLLIRNSAEQVKKLTLELGGNAPLIVFEDADLDTAADNLVANKFRAAGQTCVCANRILVQRSVAEGFAHKVAERVAQLKTGNGIEEGVDLGPLIDRAGFDKVRRHLENALQNGAVRVTGEDPPEPLGDDWGCFFPPTVLRNVTQEMTCCKEETFGPLVPILEFDSEEEAVEQANSTAFGLAAYLFTADAARAERVTAQLEFGHAGVNTATGPTPEAPFGGRKQSGYGREGGIDGLHEFTEPQTVPQGA